jgi:glycosyltransferase involved in cell wall biosynthesis
MSTAAVRVLHMFGRMEPGGAEVRLVELINHLGDEFRVDVCALSGKAGSLDAAIVACGGRVVLLGLDLAFPARFISLLRRGRYGVVHSHVLFSSGPILALAAAAGVPVRVAHLHAMHDGQPETRRRRLQRRLTRWLLERFATDVIGCGEGAMVASWGPGWRGNPRCRVIYDALDPARFDVSVDRGAVRAELGIPASATVFVHVGNVKPEKNHRRLLEIFHQIRKLDSSAWLVLAGADTDRPDGDVSRALAALGVTEGVVPLGVRDDVPRLLKAADALLLPSLREGLPGVVLEACVAGLPVLATDLPGVREIEARLALVKYLPLTASDRTWAETALTLPALAGRLCLSEHAAAAFRESVFHVDRAAEAHRRLWRRQAPPSADAQCI